MMTLTPKLAKRLLSPDHTGAGQTPGVAGPLSAQPVVAVYWFSVGWAEGKGVMKAKRVESISDAIGPDSTPDPFAFPFPLPSLCLPFLASTAAEVPKAAKRQRITSTARGSRNVFQSSSFSPFS